MAGLTNNNPEQQVDTPKPGQPTNFGPIRKVKFADGPPPSTPIRKVKFADGPPPVGGEKKNNQSQPSASPYTAAVGRLASAIGGDSNPAADPTFQVGHHAATLDQVHTMLNNNTPEQVAHKYDILNASLEAQQGALFTPTDPASMQDPAYRAKLRANPFPTPEAKAQHGDLEAKKQALASDKAYMVGLRISSGNPANAKTEGYRAMGILDPETHSREVAIPEKINAAFLSDYEKALSTYKGTHRGAKELPIKELLGLPHQSTFAVSPEIQMQAEAIGLQNNINKGEALITSLDPWVKTRDAALAGARSDAEYQNIQNAYDNSPEGKSLKAANDMITANGKAMDGLAAKYPEAVKRQKALADWQKTYDSYSGAKKTLYNIITAFTTGVVDIAQSAANTISKVGGPTPEAENEALRDQEWNAEDNYLTHMDVPKKSGPQELARGLGNLLPTIGFFALSEGMGASMMESGLAEDAGAQAMKLQALKQGIGRSMGRLAAVGVTTYGNSYDEAISAGKKPGQARNYALLTSALTYGVFSANPPSRMMSSVFAKSVLKDADKEGILDFLDKPETFAKGAKMLAKTIGASLGDAVKPALLGTAQGALATVAQGIEQSTLHPKVSPKMFQDLKDNTAMFVLASLGLHMLGVIGNPRSAGTEMSRDYLHEAAQNPDTYKALIARKQGEGTLSEDQAARMNANIDKAVITYKSLPSEDLQGKPLSTEIRKALLYNQFKKDVLLQKGDQAVIESAKKDYGAKAAALDNLDNHLIGAPAKEPLYAIDDHPASREQVVSELDKGRTEGLTILGDKELEDRLHPPKPAEGQQAAPEPVKDEKVEKIQALTAQQGKLEDQMTQARERGNTAEHDNLQGEHDFLEQRKQVVEKYGMDYHEMIQKLRDEGKLKINCPGKMLN